MEDSLLKLMVEKGPRQGESLELKPGSKKIRIGRVVKGNTFTIKDDGISSKHLLIEFQDTEWVLYDLDTSNGTFLNGVQLQPNTVSGLKDGDQIKIGERTSIKVSIIQEKEEESKPKQTKGVSKKVGKITAATVASAASVDDNAEEFDLENGVGQFRRNPKRGAAVKNRQQILQSSLVSVNKYQKIRRKEKQDIVPSVEENGGLRRGRKRGAASKNESVETVSVAVSELNIVEKDEEMRNSRGGEPSHYASISVSEAPNVNERSNNTKETGDAHAEKLDSLKMTFEQLEKMSLREWFDFMEGYLVKKVHEETDEIIAGMRERAKRLKTFMSEQQNLQNRSPLS